MSKSLISTNMPSPKPLLPIHYLFFILFTTPINQSNSARNLDHPKRHPHQQISFSMPHTLRQTHPPSKPNGQHNLPFSKPLGFFPPIGGIPLTTSNPNNPGTRVQPQTLDLEGITMSFPAATTLQELELGTVTTINENVYEGSIFIGKAEGVHVVSSEDGSSHMMAMTASFVGSDNQYEDGLRFFGAHKNDAEESHLAVIGGTGKYHGANGYATVKTLNISDSRSSSESEDGSYKLLLFNVYLG